MLLCATAVKRYRGFLKEMAAQDDILACDQGGNQIYLFW
jgi:hypothetical protein